MSKDYEIRAEQKKRKIMYFSFNFISTLYIFLSGCGPHGISSRNQITTKFDPVFLLPHSCICAVDLGRQCVLLEFALDVSIQGLEVLQKLAWKVMSVLYGSCLKKAGVYMNQLMKAKVYSL